MKPNRLGFIRWAIEEQHVTGLALSADFRFMIDQYGFSRDDDDGLLAEYRKGLGDSFVNELDRFIEEFNRG